MKRVLMLLATVSAVAASSAALAQTARAPTVINRANVTPNAVRPTVTPRTPTIVDRTAIDRTAVRPGAVTPRTPQRMRDPADVGDNAQQRRRWNAANPGTDQDHARRRWNAANPDQDGNRRRWQDHPTRDRTDRTRRPDVDVSRPATGDRSTLTGRSDRGG